MERELTKESAPKAVPSWWHDALRQNFEGNMYNKDKFVSYTVVCEEEDYQYSFMSLTAPDPETDLPPGIYLETDIPIDMTKSVGRMVFGVISDFKQVLNKYNSETRPQTEPKLEGIPGTDLFFNEETSITGYIIHAGSNITVLLAPPDRSILPERTDVELLLDEMVNEIFVPKSYIEQLKLLFSDEVPDEVKKRFLKKEYLSMEFRFALYNRLGYVNEKDLINMGLDYELQDSFEQLMRRIQLFRTKAEGETLYNRILCMDNKTLISWHLYFTGFWAQLYPDLFSSGYEEEEE
ncbi:MAG TPA: hypothetical protein VJ227_04655 [Patescibacteria group bacterium]|nr:hypothetical protein [Patescibacteria group bacterium]